MVIYGVAAGRRAALSIHRYLRGLKGPFIISDEKYHLLPQPPPEPENLDQVRPRVVMPRMQPEKRVVGFHEVEMGFTEEQARLEAARCLRCDLERIREMEMELSA